MKLPFIRKLTLPADVQWPQWQEIKPEDVKGPKFGPELYSAMHDPVRNVFYQQRTMNVLGHNGDYEYQPSQNVAFILTYNDQVLPGYLEITDMVRFYNADRTRTVGLYDLNVWILGNVEPVKTYVEALCEQSFPSFSIAPDDPRLVGYLHDLMSSRMYNSAVDKEYLAYIKPEHLLYMPCRVIYRFPPPKGPVVIELMNPFVPAFLEVHINWSQEPDVLLPGPNWLDVGHKGGALRKAMFKGKLGFY